MAGRIARSTCITPTPSPPAISVQTSKSCNSGSITDRESQGTVSRSSGLACGSSRSPGIRGSEAKHCGAEVVATISDDSSKPSFSLDSPQLCCDVVFIDPFERGVKPITTRCCGALRHFILHPAHSDPLARFRFLRFRQLILCVSTHFRQEFRRVFHTDFNSLPSPLFTTFPPFLHRRPPPPRDSFSATSRQGVRSRFG